MWRVSQPRPPFLSMWMLMVPVNGTPWAAHVLSHSPSPAPRHHGLPCLSASEHTVPTSWKLLLLALPVNFACYSSFKPRLTCHHLSEWNLPQLLPLLFPLGRLGAWSGGDVWRVKKRTTFHWTRNLVLTTPPAPGCSKAVVLFQSFSLYNRLFAGFLSRL